MPLTISKSPTHDLTLTIDDEPVRTHIKRLTKDEVIAYERDFFRFGPSRGTATLSEDETRQRERDARDFVELSVRAYVSFERGDCVDETGAAIVTGDQILDAFYARRDVLTALFQAIYSENCLGKAQKKILNSQPTFSPGSTRSTAIPSGPELAPTATAAGSSTSAASEGAMVGPAAFGKVPGRVQ